MMNLSASLTAAIFTACAAGVVLLINRRKNSEAGALLMLAASIILWSGSFLLYQQGLIALKWLTAGNYLFAALAASAHLLFSIYHTEQSRWISLHIALGFLLEPVLIQALYWLRPMNAVFFESSFQVGNLLNEIYVIFILFTSMTLLVEPFLRKPPVQTAYSQAIAFFAFIPLAVIITTAILGELQPDAALDTLGYAVMLAGVAYIIFSKRFTRPDLITRNIAIEGMEDGWMVVDANGIIVDLNPSAEEIVGAARSRLYGMHISEVLGEWRSLTLNEQMNETEMRRSVRSQNGGWRYLNVRVSRLHDNGRSPGHLVIWRDITQRKLSEDARQRSRDELFMLLNTISSASSQTSNLEEFLSDVIQQIIYPFRSEAGVVYLVDETRLDENKKRLTLAAHAGIPPARIREIGGNSVTQALAGWLFAERDDALYVSEDVPASNPVVPPAFRGMSFVRTALMPLVVTSQHEVTVVGCILLARSEDTPYTADERLRLNAIAGQIATLIDSDRRRQFTIALAERQNLMRDLHDSVSQKLYGLLALTEAAQAGYEAGSEVDARQVLTRIGDNARMAVREMRLFLYEMQPVDLAEGLVSTLHHRLAAVEGRADIKARITADENLALSKDREIAMYFITQEALNNILRHAKAHSVLVNIKQTRQNITLEITDDGCGFDPKKVGVGGMGLSNMKERARKMGGKINIKSAPGAGTQITVTIPRKIQE